MRKDSDFDIFNAAMDSILKANPAAVKAAMEAEKRERAAVRKAKRASAARASTASGQKVVSSTLPVTSA